MYAMIRRILVCILLVGCIRVGGFLAQSALPRLQEEWISAAQSESAGDYLAKALEQLRLLLGQIPGGQ